MFNNYTQVVLDNNFERGVSFTNIKKITTDDLKKWSGMILSNIFYINNKSIYIDSLYNRSSKFLSPTIIEFLIQFNLVKQKNQLLDLLENIDKYLSDNNISHQVEVDVFSDYEYINWKQLKILIRVDESLRNIYETIEPNIYKFLNNQIPEKLLDKIFLKFESTYK